MKWATITATSEVLAEIAGVIGDAGLRITGSLPNVHPETVRLIIEGEALPDGARGCEVNLLFQAETYGKQRLVRLSEVRLVAPAVQAA